LPELHAGRSELPREQAHYVSVVHRLGNGDRFTAFDPESCLECDAQIVEVNRARVACLLEAPRAADIRGLGVTLLQGAAKGDRLDSVVRAATALGVDALRIVLTERSVAHPREMKVERLRAIAIEAARQCGRGDVPRLEGPEALAACLPSFGAVRALKLCLTPAAHEPLANLIRDWTPGTPVVLLVGPEGGLSAGEEEAARASGFAEAALGPLTLRTELAALAALACFAGRLPGRVDTTPDVEE
jgi:16S rRNA (uracil1498-N3)-methyltransferase